MTKKSILTTFLIAATCFSTHQPANAALSMFSRANCLPLLEVNESISWDATLTKHNLFTYGFHLQLGAIYGHSVSTNGLEFTWRSYAGHNGDKGKSVVTGTHYYYKNGTEYTYSSRATDCNLGIV